MLEALARELEEEGNVALTGPPVLHGVLLNPHASPRDHVAVYVVRAFEWKGPPRPNLEIREAAFFPVDALPEGTTAGTRRRIEEIVRGLPPPPTW